MWLFQLLKMEKYGKWQKMSKYFVMTERLKIHSIILLVACLLVVFVLIAYFWDGTTMELSNFHKNADTTVTRTTATNTTMTPSTTTVTPSSLTTTTITPTTTSATQKSYEEFFCNPESTFYDSYICWIIYSRRGDRLTLDNKHKTPSSILINHLIKLNLEYNAIEKLEANVFHYSNNLEVLLLTGNKLSSLPDGIFDKLHALKLLSIDSNKLEHLQSHIFRNLLSLEYLLLGDNKLSSLSDGMFDELHALKVLSINSNKLEHLQSHIFHNLTSLEYLQLSDNRLTNLSKGIFNGLEKLRILSISFNKLTKLESETFSGLTHLEVLDISSNIISSFDHNAFKGLDNLNYLLMDFLDITELPDDLFDDLCIEKLQCLYLIVKSGKVYFSEAIQKVRKIVPNAINGQNCYEIPRRRVFG